MEKNKRCDNYISYINLGVGRNKPQQSWKDDKLINLIKKRN